MLCSVSWNAIAETRHAPACCLFRVLAGLRRFAAAPESASAQSDPFYKGKRLTLLINFAAGGPADIEGRLFARHFGKHIDGAPNIIVQNRDGAGGLVGTNYFGELGPRDGTMAGYLTAAAWNYVIDPASYRVDFSTYEFVAYQPVNVVYYMRADTPPGMKDGAGLMKATGLVAGGLAANSSKDLLIRLTLDMLGVPYKYVTGFRSSAPARLALQRGEINFFSESSPSYFGVVEPTMVKSGRRSRSGTIRSTTATASRRSSRWTSQGVPGFPDFHRKVKGTAPSGRLWDVYRTNLAVDSAMLRTVVLPPGVPAAAVDALRRATERLNGDAEFAPGGAEGAAVRSALRHRRRPQRAGAPHPGGAARDQEVRDRLHQEPAEIRRG